MGRGNYILLGKIMLVVMHPNLKNSSLHSNLLTELLHHTLLLLLNLPSNFLCKPQHLLLLLRRELRSESLLVHHRPWIHPSPDPCPCRLLLLLRLWVPAAPTEHVVRHYHVVGLCCCCSWWYERRPSRGWVCECGSLWWGDHVLSTDEKLPPEARGVKPIVGFSFYLFSMEVSMTVAGRACEGFNGAFFSTRHKLAAAIRSIASHGSCMVFETFFVFDMLLVVVAAVVIVIIVMVVKVNFHLRGWKWASTIDGGRDDVVAGGRGVMVVVDDMVMVVAAVTTI